jgi:hypothetical protein
MRWSCEREREDGLAGLLLGWVTFSRPMSRDRAERKYFLSRETIDGPVPGPLRGGDKIKHERVQ